MCDAAIQIHSAYGLTSEFGLAQGYRSVRSLAIATGTIASELDNRSHRNRYDKERYDGLARRVQTKNGFR